MRYVAIGVGVTMASGLVISAARADLTATPKRSACYAVWKDVTPAKKRTVTCEDGNPACDADGEKNGACTLALDLCFNQEVANCAPAAINTVSINPPQMTAGGDLSKGRGRVKTPLALPTFDPAGTGVCLDAALVEVPLRSGKGGARASKPVKIVAKVKTAGKPRKGTNKLVLQCLPPSSVGDCPGNPAGPPDQLALRVRSPGDLDNGWTGISFNFPNPVAFEVKFCLSECDATGDPECTAVGPTGEGALNGTLFGPPLPLLAAGIPVCVVNAYKGDMTGRANVAIGSLDGLVPLESQVWFTTGNSVCPQCSGKDVGDTGTCNSGPRAGKACRTESIFDVALALGDDKRYEGSTDCPPGPPSTFAGALDIPLPLKTTESSLSGATPCTGPGGVTPQPDGCPAGGVCNARCTGSACQTTTAANECVDAKGGLSQLCCSNATATACHPLRDGGTLTRTGSATLPVPAWPDPTYPKVNELDTVGVFCEAATTSATVNISTGLPGPGAVILPVTGTWEDLP